MRSPSGQQSHLRPPLTRLFANPGNVRVPRVLTDGLAVSATQIAAAAGLTPEGARMVLDGLVTQGMVTVKGAARAQLFELAGAHPFRHPVLALFQAERAVWERLVARLRERHQKRPAVQAAWRYGSVARGEAQRLLSELDVFAEWAESTL